MQPITLSTVYKTEGILPNIFADMMGFKPTIFGETIRHVDHYTTHPYFKNYKWDLNPKEISIISHSYPSCTNNNLHYNFYLILGDLAKTLTIGTPKTLSRRWDSNPRQADYKSATLPTELHLHFLLRKWDSNPRHLSGGLAYETSEIDQLLYSTMFLAEAVGIQPTHRLLTDFTVFKTANL